MDGVGDAVDEAATAAEDKAAGCWAALARVVASRGIYRWSCVTFHLVHGAARGRWAHDPLSAQGARELYWRRRNAAVETAAVQLAVSVCALCQQCQTQASPIRQKLQYVHDSAPLSLHISPI